MHPTLLFALIKYLHFFNRFYVVSVPHNEFQSEKATGANLQRVCQQGKTSIRKDMKKSLILIFVCVQYICWRDFFMTFFKKN